MKKGIFTMLAMALCLVPAFSQEKKGTLIIEPKVGVNTSKFVGNAFAYSPKWKIGWHGGAAIEWFVADGQSLSFGLDYRQVGCKFDYKNTINTQAQHSTEELQRLTAHYLALPVIYSYYIGKSGFSLKAGVEVEGLLSAKLKSRSHGSIVGDGSYSTADDQTQYVWHDFDVSESTEMKHDFKRVAVAIPVGVGYDYKNLAVEALFHIDLNKCVKYTEGTGGMFNQPYKDRGERNMFVELTVGYKFKI